MVTLILLIFTWFSGLLWLLFYYRFRKKHIHRHGQLAGQFRNLPGFDLQGRGLSLDEKSPAHY